MACFFMTYISPVVRGRDCPPHDWSSTGKGNQEQCSKCGAIRDST